MRVPVPSLQEFQDKLRDQGPVACLPDVVGGEWSALSQEQFELIEAAASTEIPAQIDGVYVVGSAKLGFSLSEKTERGVVLPRWRAFSERSDIDVAVISREYFVRVWKDAAPRLFRHTSRRRVEKCIVGGWLPGAELLPLSNEQNLLGQLPYKVRQRLGGVRLPSVKLRVYYDIDFLHMYQMRSLEECRRHV